MGSELLCKRGCYGSTELSIVVPSDAGANFFCNRPRCFRNSPAPRSALRPKRVTLRATQGFAPTGVRELIHQEVGPNGKIKRGQIKLTESRFFGQPPMRDIKALRDGKVVAITTA